MCSDQENTFDIPLTVWLWQTNDLILLWGEHALNSLRSCSFLKKKAQANWKFISREFQILVFENGNAMENAVYGGKPVLCYNVLSSIIDPTMVVQALFSRGCNKIWVFNPQWSEFRMGKIVRLHVTVVKEGDDMHCLYPLFPSALKGEEKELKELLTATNATPSLAKSPMCNVFDMEEEEEHLVDSDFEF